jgi:hypothetical protein
MYFIEIGEYLEDNVAYIFFSLDKVKELLIKLFLEWSDRWDYKWSSLNDSVLECESLEDLSYLVYCFADETSTTFRFSCIEEGQVIYLIN